MKEDRSGDSTGTTGRSWLERLGQALAGGPEDRDDLKDILKEAQARGIIDAEALSMMEGALTVAERQVRDVMIPRGQMIVMQADWPVERLLAEIIESGHSRLPVIGEDRDEGLGEGRTGGQQGEEKCEKPKHGCLPVTGKASWAARKAKGR